MMRKNWPQKGYVLALNLAVLALMLVLATFVGKRVLDAVDLARAEQADIDHQYVLTSARARVIMLLATASRTPQGLGTAQSWIALDGRPYRLDDEVVVTLQDQRGLMSVNGLALSGYGRERLERLLGTYGIAAQTAGALTDAVLDYRDSDGLRRLNGAERDDYRNQGRESDPRNADLLSVTEVARIHGWREVAALWGDDPAVDHLSTQRGDVFNPNTATWRALVAMAGVDASMAKGLVAERQRNPGADMAAFLFGDRLGDPFGRYAFVNPFPGPTIIVTLRHVRQRWGWRMVVTHTPAEKFGPWRIGESWRVPLPSAVAATADIPLLPSLADLRDERTVTQIKF